MSKIDVKIKYLSEKIGSEIKAPCYATDGSAGMDLAACIDEPLLLKPGQKDIIPTGIAIGLHSKNYVALVFGRSGLGIKHGITLSNSVGVIDSDYTGEIKCGIINLGDTEHIINPGDRIAQMIFVPIALANLIKVDELDVTGRGSGGFGSTGK